MVRKSTLAALMVGVVLSSTAAYAQNPDDCIREGRVHMFDNTLSGLRMAYQIFDDCLNDPLCPECSSNRELVFLHALMRSTLLFIDNNDLVVSDSFLELAGAFGLVVQGDSFDPCDTNPVDVNVLMDLDGCYRIPPGAPDLVGIREVLDYSIIPEINDIVTELNTIADSNVSRFKMFFEPNETGLQKNLEVDYGEVLILKGLLLGFKGFLGAQLAYDLYLDVNDARIDSLLFDEGICPNDVNSLELSDFIDINDPNGNLSINDDLLGRYSDLLKVLPTPNFPDVNGMAILAQSAADLIAAVDYYLDALDYIVSEDNPPGTDPQEDELVYVDPNDRGVLDGINQKLIILRDSLASDTVGVYRLETTKTYDIYNLSHMSVGELVLLYDLFGMAGEGGNLSFADGNSVPSPWEVEWFEIVDSNLIQIGLTHFSDGEWLGGYFEGAISPDCNTITGGTFEYWGYDSGALSGLSAQHVSTDVLDGHLDLNPLFGGSGRYPSPVNPRDLLTEFDQKNEPASGTFGHGLGDDPTLGGIFPDMTQELWAILFDLPVPGLRFYETARLKVGDNPTSLVIADFNGDGFPDIFTTNSVSSDVSLLLGLSNGSFQEELRFAAGLQPSSAVVGDLNGDGVLDGVVANAGSDDVGVRINHPGGPPDLKRFDVGAHPRSVAIGDLNGDETIDIVTANYWSQSLSILFGIGEGDFQEQQTFETGSGPCCVALGDLNSDGALDIVTADDWSSTISVLLGIGDGTFEPRRVLGPVYGASSVALGDLNGDDMLDIVATGLWSNGVVVFLGQEDGSFQGPRSFGDNTGQHAVVLGDVNGDGILDAVTAETWDDRVRVFLGAGDGSFDRGSGFDIEGEPQSVALEDLNSDGLLDIITANNRSGDVAILINKSEMYGHYPSGSTRAPVSVIQVHFPSAMDPCSFSVAEDVVSFTGPQGSIDIEGYEWLDSRTLEIRFNPQSLSGIYKLTIGPEILDARGRAMDLDRDSIRGEIPDDQYVAVLSLSGPRIIGQVPSGLTVGSIERLHLRFSHEMDQMSFSLAGDIVSFSGPGGPVTAIEYNWVDPRLLEISFQASLPGEYEMVVGPDILDLAGNPMDQDFDFSPGEAPDDWYTAGFEIIVPPRIVSHDPAGVVTGPVQALRLSFDQAMDTGSFSPFEDIVGFTGPEGFVQLESFDWIDSQTLELTFEMLLAPGTYELVVGPHILSTDGIAMNQDGDTHLGEIPDDRYVAFFELPMPFTVVSQWPSGAASKPVESLRCVFTRPVDQNSFSIEEDIIDSDGPQGQIVPTSYQWLDGQTLEIRFGALVLSGNYKIVLSPQILDLEGEALDIDGDFLAGETPDDEYVATFNIPIDLPKTGQATSYAAGDDGDVQAGVTWPEPRFVDNGDGTVTDGLTGLMWTKNADLLDSATDWIAALDYVTKMNLGEHENFAHTNWRMPNTLELESLVNAEAPDVAAWLRDQGFVNVPENLWWYPYWSSSNSGGNVSVLWLVEGGEMYTTDISDVGLLWAVRSADVGAVPLPRTGITLSEHEGDDGDLQLGVEWPQPRFVDNNDGTVTDNLTSLMWTRDADVAGTSMTWQEALDYVKSLNDARHLGYEDWRLPNRRDIFSLFDFESESGLPTGHPFTNLPMGGWWYPGHWTSTTCGFYTDAAWGVWIGWPAGVYSTEKNWRYLLVWPVRGGRGPVGTPGVIWHAPCGAVKGAVSKVTLRFNEDMDTSSFSFAEDVFSFTGPGGIIVPTDFVWTDSTTLEITFPLQTLVGAYTLTIGPQIVSKAGNQMNQDDDLVRGEVPDDQYIASFYITPPEIVMQAPSGTMPGTFGSVRFYFDRPMDETSFSVAEDIVSFTGPAGDVPVTDYNWVSSDILEITFETQKKAGKYEIVLGPGIVDTAGNSITGHKATFVIKAPKVLRHTPIGSTLPPVGAIIFEFDRPMDQGSFSLIGDIVVFTGPSGSAPATGFTWLDPNTLKVTFGPQWAMGSYEMVIGPQILDTHGNAFDQDGDLVIAEVPEDQYPASFAIAYSGTITQDTSLGPEHGPIVVDGPVTIQSGVTLTVEAGTIVKFANTSAGIIVNGILKINGTPQKRVILTSFKDDTAGGDTNGDGSASSPSPGDWMGIAFCNTTEMSSLEGIEIRYSSEGACVGYWYEPPLGIARLRNAILRDNTLAIVARVAYSEIEVTNCLVISNREALALRNTAWVRLRNCTIVDNISTGDVRYAVLTIENSVFAFNQSGFWNLNQLDDLIVRNSAFYGPDAQAMLAAVQEQVFSNNGNIVADPLFVGRTAGNYELSAGSPVIDAGGGVGALTTDIVGHPRYDDQGVPNRGSGFPSYVDIGAFERQQDTANADLAVTYVTKPAPEFLNHGGSFTVEWAVTNVGVQDANGAWEDAVYLSNDPYLSSDGVVLERRAHTGALLAGQSYTQTLTTNIPPSISGLRYVLVRANATRSLAEPVELNNVVAAPGVVAVNLPVLTLSTPVSGTIGHNKWAYVRFDAAAGNTVIINLDVASSYGAAALYVRYGMPPTLNEHDAAGAVPYSPDQQLRILSPLEGTYYIGIYGTYLPGYSKSYTLSGALTSLNIRTVSPNRVGNAGRATIKIEGDNFNDDAQVKLAGPGGISIGAEEYFQDATTLFATFDLATAGAGAGLYDIVVTNPDESTTTLNEAVTVEAGGEPEFRATLTMPALTRPGRVMEVGIDCTNPGTVDVPSPVLTLVSNPDDCQWRLPDHDTWIPGPDFRVMGLSSEGPATILRPGQTQAIIAELLVPFRPGSVTVKLSSVGATPTDGSNTLINWTEFENDIRPDCPDCIDPNTWDQTFENLQSQIGDTWGEYAEVLRENANRWSKAGRGVYYVPELFAMEMAEAQGLPTALVTGSVTDSLAVRPVEGVTVALRDNVGTTLHSALIQPDGTFLMESVGPGTYTLVVDGYLVQGNPQLEIAQDLFGIPVRVIRAAQVVGNVTGPSTEPVDGAWVTLSSPGIEPFGTFTDANGYFAFTTVPDGNWGLFVQADGYVMPEPLSVQIIGPGTRDLDVVLVTGASISGLITDAQGVPLQGADVVASVQGGTSAIAQTDANGYYTLRGLSAGDCLVKVSAEGYVSDSRNVPALELDDALEDIDFLMQPGLPITGQVTEAGTGSALEGVTLIFFCEDQFVAMAITDANGNFLTNECYSGQYSVEYSLPGYQPAQESFLLPPEGLQEPLQLILQPEVVVQQSSAVIRADFLTGKLDARTPDLDEKELHKLAQDWLKKLLCPTASSHLLHFILPIGPDINKVPAPCIYHPDHRVSEWAKKATTCCVTFEKSKKVAEDQLKAKLALKVCSARDLPTRLDPVKTKPLIFYCGGDCVDTASCGNCLPHRGAFDLCMAFGTMNDAICHVVNIYPVKESEAVITVKVVTLYIYNDYYVFKEEHCLQNPLAPWNCWAWRAQQAGYATPFRTRIEISDSFEHSIPKLPKSECDPDPDDKNEDQGTTGVQTSVSPEDKWGPAGYDAPNTPPGQQLHYIRPSDASKVFDYRIEIWNKPDAPVPTQDATIYDVLDANVFDLSTFEFTRVGFLKWDVPLPGGQAVDVRVDCRPEMNIAVDIKGTFDPQTGRIDWWFHCVDPMTGDYPEDPNAGFLPPYNPETGFEIGWMEFRVKPKAGLPIGTQLANQAFVQFDFLGPWGPAPKEGPWVNTIANPRDLYPSGQIDIRDIAVLSDRWLWQGSGGGIPEDIVPDGTVNFIDLAAMTEK